MGVQSFISVVERLLLLLSGDIETNPGPIEILSTEKHLQNVLRAVWSIRAHWRILGGELDLPKGTIDSFHEQNDGENLHKVLSTWIHSGTATIYNLLEKLEGEIVHNPELAKKIRARIGEDRVKVGLDPDTGHQSNGSNADSVTGGPSGASSGPTSNAQWIEPVEPITISSIELSPKVGKIGVGKSASLTVEVTGTSPTYKWFRNDSEELLTDSAVYKDTTTATLHIEEATTDLSGNYWCEVSNEISPKEKSSPVHLDVIEKPVIVEKSEDRIVKLGEPVVLTVTAKGRDMEFNWVKHGDHPNDGITINPDTDQNYETELETDSDQNEISKLVIKTPIANMTGNYSCKISNLGGTVSPPPRVYLTVMELITISCIELSPKEGNIGVGKSASLTVEVTGTSPTYKWFRNDSEEPLTDSAVYKDTTTATLHIKEATTELSGNYWCEVSNEISPNKKSSSVHLDVIEKPVIVEKSENRIVKLGEPVVLTVTAKGRYMEFNWVKHGDHPDDDITINPDNDQNYETESQTDSDQNVIFKLVIKTATANTSGNYSCKISNLGGTVSPPPRVCLTVSIMSFATSMSCDDICLWLRQNDATDDDVQVLKKQGIDGDAFTQLPSDRTQLREEFQLTFGGAIKIVKLLSEVQTNKPGHQSIGSNADSATGGQSGASGPTPNAQWIEPGHQSNGSNADSVAGGPSGASSGPTSNAQWIEPGGIPRLDQLRSFQLHNKKSIDIAQKIVLNYEQFATLLLEDDDGAEMAVIRGTVGPNPVNIVVAVLTQWLQRGSATWGSLVGTLRKTKLDALANEIESMNRVKNI